MRAITAVLAVVLTGLTVAAYGSGASPWSTSAAGPDVIDPAAGAPAAIHRLQTPEQELPVSTTAPTITAAVPQAPAKDPAPAARTPKRPKAEQDDDPGDEDNGEHGKGHGLGNTYCQSLKGTGGPAFGHCIAAKAHELHQHREHR
ncbi:MAG TPA: hypothetical protein VH247_02765 [Thermoleophilaceae bacterium]|jgi:hypothetical protein|nr:hypothetical protein [Thermoleophilaceae bacterium]